MDHGIIFKGIGGFYYVKYNQSIYECKARGKFKNQNKSPMVGDFVEISILDEIEKKGMIEELLPRNTELLRPSVANVNQAIIVFSIKDPMPNITLLDKMLVLAENAGLDIVICFNKGDLDAKLDFESVGENYKKAGYPTIKTCALLGEGIEELSTYLVDKISVFSGPSGVGKSSILNAIEEKFALKTGTLSEKIKRGKHTTRHSELLDLVNGGIVVDTPGFTSLSLEEIEPEILKQFFPEFRILEESCRFDNCLHLNEPGCSVKEAVSDKKLAVDRYNAYVYIYKEIDDLRRKKKW
ncbi:MAG: ribosome small subunit-dependent GTPase A [Clostridia bacterium]|nr:ribosome small subunit-dependent GTPase A [Clostridia bacterium]